jgi:radical SAM protein with 4Fe4S-binding SPASM domain
MMVITLAKPLNLFLAEYSYLKSTFSGNVSVYGMPVSLGVELTNHCNLQCAECASGSGVLTRKRGFMEIGLFDKLIAELRPYLYNINLYFQGESMLHPEFFTFLGKSVKTHTTVSTNGHYLSLENSKELVKSGLNKLTVSVDGMNQITYESYRKNGSLETVMTGIRNIADAKRKYRSPLHIEIQFLVNRVNESQIPDIRHFAKEVKATLKLKSMQIINQEDMPRWLPSRSKFRRYEKRYEEYEIKSSLPDKCMRLWFNPVVTWDGKVVPCCFDKDADHIMGDVTRDSFRDIWDGPEFRTFRKSILSGRHMVKICRNCTSGLKGARI